MPEDVEHKYAMVRNKGGIITRIKSNDVIIVRHVNPFINLKFKAGEVKDVKDEIANVLLKELPGKFEKEELL